MPATVERADPSETVRPVLDAMPGLLVVTRLWARRAPTDPSVVRAAFDDAVLRLHRHYVATIPVYRRLALERDLGDVDDVAVLARELMLSSEVFKSYDADWVTDGDLARLTRWLATIFTRDPEPVLDGVAGIAGWRAALRDDGVFVTLSSGTGGLPSFVPRDRLTLTALRRNGTLHRLSPDGLDAMPPSFDLLALTPRDAQTGLQAAGVGLAARAARAHHLDAEADGAWEAALEFLRDAGARRQAVLVFGPPPLVAVLCLRAVEGRADDLAPGSLVATGGGWKGGPAIAPAELADRVERALGVGRERIVDTYGTAELNAVLVRCPHDRYHVPPLLRAVVLDPLLMPIEPGPDAYGRLGFLDPFAFSYPGFVMPGDLGRLVEGRCRCGLGGQAIIAPIERGHDEAPRGCAGPDARVGVR
jgi:hypothetical protein